MSFWGRHCNKAADVAVCLFCVCMHLCTSAVGYKIVYLWLWDSSNSFTQPLILKVLFKVIGSSWSRLPRNVLSNISKHFHTSLTEMERLPQFPVASKTHCDAQMVLFFSPFFFHCWKYFYVADKEHLTYKPIACISRIIVGLYSNLVLTFISISYFCMFESLHWKASEVLSIFQNM